MWSTLKKIFPHLNAVEPEILSVVRGTEFANHPEKYGVKLWATERMINDSWCYGFSHDIPWTFSNDCENVKIKDLPLLLTSALNRAVKRNLERFPKDFMFQLSAEEVYFLRCQNGISKGRRGGRRYLPYAFTEQGVAMFSSFEAIQQLLAPPGKPGKKIGFMVKEKRAAYGKRAKRNPTRKLKQF